MLKERFVFITGWSFSKTIWYDFTEQLGFVHEPLYVDGYGITDAKEIDERARRCIEQCIDDGFKVTIVGWSLGTMVALKLANEHQKVVTKVILFAATSSFVKRENDKAGWDKRVLKSMQRRLKRDKEGTLHDFDTLLVNNHAEDCYSRDHYVSDTTHSLVAGLQYLMDEDVRHALHKITQPVLLIHGEDDKVCPIHGMAYIRGRIHGDVAIQIFKRAGHLPFILEKEKCVEAVQSFVNHY